MLSEIVKSTRKCGAALIVALAFFVVLPSCGPSRDKVTTYAIGQKVQVGKLSYQVVDAQWRTEVPGGKEPLKNRVLQLHLMITNSAGQEATVPMLRLVDASNKEIGEIAEIEGNSRWMGVIRRLQPALTEEGYVYFDVPVGPYRLEVVDNSQADSEKTAYIEIPVSLAPPPSVPG